MPQAVLVPALTAGLPALGQLGGAIMGNRANNRAQQSQDRAAQAAMNYQRQKDKQARDDYRFQYNAWLQQNGQGPRATPAALANTGVTFGAPGATPAAVAPAAALPSPEVAPVVAAPGTAPVADGTQQLGTTLADMGPWSASNFGRYLGRR